MAASGSPSETILEYAGLGRRAVTKAQDGCREADGSR
jgi:hypothetical protein